MEAAIAIFETATLNAQQSGLATSISQFQNSKNPFARLFLAFKNTSNQYFRKQVDAIISYQNGDIPIGQLAKTTMIYSVIQPILYVSAGFVTATGIKLLARSVGLRDDEEDAEELTEKLLNDIMVQLVVSPVNAIPLLNDAVRAAARKVSGQKVYKVFSLPLFNELETAIRSLTKEEISGIDYLKIAGAILEPITAAPVVSGLRYFDLFTGKLGKKKKDVLVR